MDHDDYSNGKIFLLAASSMKQFLLILPFLLSILTLPGGVSADIVTVADSTATGTSDRASANDFIGILSNDTPNQVNGLDINFIGQIPTGESFQVGDIVGRDVNATSGSRNWEYQIILPPDAVSGTGFTNITFNGRAFERATDNLERNDRVRWLMYLNNDATPVQIEGPATGSDWTTFDVNLSDTGTSTVVTQVRVVFNVNGFNGGGEWFAARGTLQADYQSIPEPVGVLVWLLAFTPLMGRNRVV